MRGCIPGTVLLLALLLGGCSPLRGSPKETIVSSDAIEALAKTFDLSGNIEAYNTPGATEPVKRAARDKLVDCGIALIDARYSEFVKEFTASKKTTDTLAEVGSMGLNTAGALMSPASTVRNGTDTPSTEGAHMAAKTNPVQRSGAAASRSASGPPRLTAGRSTTSPCGGSTSPKRTAGCRQLRPRQPPAGGIPG
jgi:hypothetical protein